MAVLRGRRTRKRNAKRMETLWSSGSHTHYGSCASCSLESTAADGTVCECRFCGYRSSKNGRPGSVKRAVLVYEYLLFGPHADYEEHLYNEYWKMVQDSS